MIRKLLLIAAIAAGMTFAQSESTQSYTAAQPKTAQAAPEADPAWNVSIHPASLVVFSALGLRSSDYYDIDDDASFSALVFGLAGGFRFYLNPGHNGLYFEAQLQYAHTGITYDDEEKFGSASSNTFGPYALAGWKFVNGRLTLALDAGVGFNIVSASSEDGSVKRTATDIEKDTELFKASGFSTDINLTLGIAF